MSKSCTCQYPLFSDLDWCLFRWVGDWMSGWLIDCSIDWLIDWLSDWVTEWESERASEWAGERMNGWASERVSEWVSEPASERNFANPAPTHLLFLRQHLWMWIYMMHKTWQAQLICAIFHRLVISVLLIYSSRMCDYGYWWFLLVCGSFVVP